MPVYLNKDWINAKLAVLPDLPGCYIMRNEADEIIYIGKAKNLKNRVRSYFRAQHTGKTERLVQEIHHFSTIVTQSDKEAFLLEISLIQRYKPRYNIRLKDSSMYPYLKITKERNPQLLITSHVDKDGAMYFGPYPNVYAASDTLQFIQKIYPLRRCGKNEKRACFYYHLGQCIGCCDHEISEAEYAEQIRHISDFLNGKTGEIKALLMERMEEAAANLNFEKAAEYRDQIRHIDATVERQDILSLDYTNRDVFHYVTKRGYMAVQVFLLRQSTIIKQEAAIFPIYDTEEEEFLSFVLMFYQNDQHILPKEILLPDTIDPTVVKETLGVPVAQPKRGKKRRMMALAEQNARIALDQKLAIEDKRYEKTAKASEELAAALGIPSAHWIESFDHSHIQGVYPVSGMVVYKDGKPAKALYRKFHLKTVVGGNEFESTREVVRRRYGRLLKENKGLPDLILMDGGIVEIRAALDVLENELGLSIPVAGMVKNDKHQTASLVVGEEARLIPLAPSDLAFQLLQRIQDEVHRYAITFHRQTRNKGSLTSQLLAIEGVGKKTQMKLYHAFKSTDKMEEASVEDFQQLGIPQAVAQRLKDYFTLKKINKTR